MPNLAFLSREDSQYNELVFQGLKEEAQLHGYSVERHALGSDVKKQQQLVRVLHSRGARGLLFGPSNQEWSFSNWNWDKFVMVSLGAILHEPKMHSVCMNYFDGAYTACRSLQEAGCQRIGFAVQRRFEKRTGHQWLGGYCAALDSVNLHVFDPVCWAESSFKTWCRNHRLDGLLTVHSLIS